jgi:hypothetical protein
MEVAKIPYYLKLNKKREFSFLNRSSYFAPKHVRRMKKRIVEDNTCEVCGSSSKTASCIFFGCQFAMTFWSALHLHKQERVARVASGVVFRSEHLRICQVVLCKEEGRL